MIGGIRFSESLGLRPYAGAGRRQCRGMNVPIMQAPVDHAKGSSAEQGLVNIRAKDKLSQRSDFCLLLFITVAGVCSEKGFPSYTLSSINICFRLSR